MPKSLTKGSTASQMIPETSAKWIILRGYDSYLDGLTGLTHTFIEMRFFRFDAPKKIHLGKTSDAACLNIRGVVAW